MKDADLDRRLDEASRRLERALDRLEASIDGGARAMADRETALTAALAAARTDDAELQTLRDSVSERLDAAMTRLRVVLGK